MVGQVGGLRRLGPDLRQGQGRGKRRHQHGDIACTGVGVAGMFLDRLMGAFQRFAHLGFSSMQGCGKVWS